MAETVTPFGSSSSGTTSPTSHLLASLEPPLRTWLPRQRWFAGKGRPVTGFTPVAATELLPPDGRLGLYHLLLRVHQPSALGAPPHPGDCYQLLIGVREALPPRLAPALIGHVEDGPLAGRTVYDALHDPRPAEVLLEALRTQARVGGLCFERDTRQEIREGLVARLMTAEQSNSSVVYGDTFILKLLRRVVPGVNPDLEIPLALAREGCPRVPAPTAWLHAELDGDPDGSYVLAVLQPYVSGATDGWELALRELAKGEDFVAEARALGRATAEVHTALAHALPTVTLGHAQLQQLVDGMTERLAAAVQAVPALRPYERGLRSAYQALADLAAEGRTWTAQRVHGDLHLGQCLRSPSGEWSLIDFEGEPARPLAERRMAQPPVRDIAGMLRSFDYAAHSATPPAPDWARTCRAAYCSGYAEVAGRDPRTDPVLLRAYETDKAVYEVVYEARHRPDWLPVPLSAVRRLATSEPT
ncbi:maltokinase [Streptomyces sp. NPDC048521]|uniref:maltokinase N-terminal cap-like domain-containing protein n=1 Tax=Streptomyces sp. NPDC048521 TaxID=3365566 RepID=UPI003722145B